MTLGEANDGLTPVFAPHLPSREEQPGDTPLSKHLPLALSHGPSPHMPLTFPNLFLPVFSEGPYS